MKKFWNWIHDDSGGRVLRLEGPIDSESFWGDEITPQMFRDELYAEEGDITLWVNSPGGNVFAAAEIYTMLRDYPGNVTVRIASIAASAASVVAMAGNVVQMSPTALIMIGFLVIAALMVVINIFSLGTIHKFAGFGPKIQKLYETLTGIQMGTVEAPEGWVVEIL